MEPAIPSGLEWYSVPDKQLDDLVAFAAKDIPLPPDLREIVQEIKNRRSKSVVKIHRKSKNHRFD